MIDVLKQQLPRELPLEDKLNKTREFLQIICLKILYDKEVFNNLAFVGGTALRIIFDMKRFSEDLDFSLVNKEGYGFTELNDALLRGFKLYGFKATSKPNKEKTVHSVFLKFSGLLKEVGISPLASQALSIKIKVDTKPPAGGNLVNTYVNKIYPLNIMHYDLSSMFATKLAACFYRKYTKGRDFYDLIWYLGRKTKPNYSLLNNAIKQTQGEGPGINENNFKEFLLKNLKKIDFDTVKKDVERFLEDKTELRLLEPTLIIGSIELLY